MKLLAWMRVRWIIAVVVVTVLTLCGETNAARVARQASRCNGRPCVPVSSCASIKALLARPTAQNLRAVRNAVCSRAIRNIKVCCDDSNPNPTPVTPTKGPSTDPTVPTNPGNGEALLPSQCGPLPNGDKVVFGEAAPLGDYPWMALIGYKDARGSVDWECGGALISNRYVLTAAHCAHRQFTKGRDITDIRLGEHNTARSPDCEDGFCTDPEQDFTPEQIILHPTFDTRVPVSDDIALIRLNRPARFVVNVRPICLPPAGLNVASFVGTRQAIVAGWGHTQRGTPATVLQRAKIPYFDLDRCQTFYDNELIPDQVCFGGDGQRDTCRGDSGGPVFLSNGSNYMALGIVSKGAVDCGQLGVPAVYTNVASYRNWIVQNLRP